MQRSHGQLKKHTGTKSRERSGKRPQGATRNLRRAASSIPNSPPSTPRVAFPLHLAFRPSNLFHLPLQHSDSAPQDFCLPWRCSSKLGVSRVTHLCQLPRGLSVLPKPLPSHPSLLVCAGAPAQLGCRAVGSPGSLWCRALHPSRSGTGCQAWPRHSLLRDRAAEDSFFSFGRNWLHHSSADLSDPSVTLLPSPQGWQGVRTDTDTLPML